MPGLTGDVDPPPMGVVTVMSTDPVPGGDTAVIEVEELATYEAAGVDPKLTAEGPARLLPVMVTEVPPASGPVAGDTELIVGVFVGVLAPHV